MVLQPEKQAEKFVAAINANNPEDVLALTGPEATWTEPLSGRVEGRAAFAKVVHEMMGLARWKYEVLHVVRDDQRALVLYRASAAAKADATKKVAWQGALYLHFDAQGRLRDGIEAYDGAAVARGLGVA